MNSVDIYLLGELVTIFYPEEESENNVRSLVNEIFDEGCYYSDNFKINEGDVVLDGGANLGIFTLYAIKHGANRVLSFEMIPELSECFEKTMEINKLSDKVTLINRAILDVSGETITSGYYKEDTKKSALLHYVPDKDSEVVSIVPVKTISIDDFIEEFNSSRLDMIKLDVEKCEKQAILGARNTICKYLPKLAVSLYHYEHERIEIDNTLKELGLDYDTDFTFAPGEVGLYYNLRIGEGI